MTALELRTAVHDLVDRIEDEDMLAALVNFLKSSQNQNSEGLWQTLSDAEKEEVSHSYNESESKENLISKKDFLESL